MSVYHHSQFHRLLVIAIAAQLCVRGISCNDVASRYGRAVTDAVSASRVGFIPPRSDIERGETEQYMRNRAACTFKVKSQGNPWVFILIY
ncbi:hypothetical protein EDB80DRAFT_696955 [Ilyonectria destructans]|nr:hypothetical protein EDB80DRAFT_696955 [Ilyonectria destructans]